MSLDNGVLEDLLPGVIDCTLELVLRAQGLSAQDSPAGSAENLPGNFRLLLDEKSGFKFSL